MAGDEAHSVAPTVRERLALGLQRSGPRAPRLARRVARSILRGQMATTVVLDAWPTAWSGVVDEVLPPQPREQQATLHTRCLLVTDALDAGGMDQVVAFLAERLPERGFDTTVWWAPPPQEAATVEDARLARQLRERGVRVLVGGRDSFATWVERWQPAVVNAHGAPAWALDESERLGVPYVETLHGMHAHFDADWAVEGPRSARMAAVVAVSELVRRQYLFRNHFVGPERVVVVANGIDERRRPALSRAAARSALGVPDDAFLFVSLARHCLQKNSYGLLRAFAKAAEVRPSARLIIAGRPDDLAYARQLVQLRNRLGCAERIRLYDHSSAPTTLLAAADTYISDAYFEGASLASIEALCQGTRVVISDVGDAREQVGDDLRRGVVVANPLADPLKVDWRTIAASRFRAQPNEAEFVRAAVTAVDVGPDSADVRGDLRAESLERFHAGRVLDEHARVLGAAVRHF